MTKANEDPVDKLAKELAADHTLAKARAEGEPATESENEPETSTETPDELADDEPQIIGDFDSFDAVREYAEAEGLAIVTGDLAVVNGALVRFEGGAFKQVVASLIDEFAPAGVHSAAHEGEMQRLARIVENAVFDTGSLLADVRNLLLMLYKEQRVLWSGRSEQEKRDFAKQVEAQAKTLIRKITRVVAEGETISVAGKLERYTHSGSFDLKISAQSDEEAALQLFRMQGHDVVIMSADAARFLEDAKAPEVEPDEPGLPFADADPVTAEDVAELREKLDPPEDDSDLADAGFDDEDEDEVDFDDEPQDEAPAPGTGAAAIAAMNARAREAQADDGVGDYESRTNPDDEPESDADISARVLAGEPDGFEEMSESELAQQAGRAGNPEGDTLPAADYVGPKQPDDAVPGESWLDTSKDDARPRYKHPNGKFYLSPPSAESLEEWRAAQNGAGSADDDGFPADPE